MAPTLTQEDLTNLTEVVMHIFEQWQVSSAQQVLLLGLPADTRPRELRRLHGGAAFPDDQAVLDRAEHILAIHDCLRTAYPRSVNMAAHWLHQPSRHFNSRTPLDVMLEDGIGGLQEVRGHLDCTQGWH